MGPALFAALVVTQALANGRHLGVGADTAGVALAGVAAWRGASVIAVVAIAAVSRRARARWRRGRRSASRQQRAASTLARRDHGVDRPRGVHGRRARRARALRVAGRGSSSAARSAPARSSPTSRGSSARASGSAAYGPGAAVVTSRQPSASASSCAIP